MKQKRSQRIETGERKEEKVKVLEGTYEIGTERI